MKILVACEESQAVCIAFRNKGHEAYSCDTQECSGGYPEWHIQDDVFNVIDRGWDMMIGFPPCTHLANAGGSWFEGKRADGRQEQAILFFYKLLSAPIKKIALENPIGILGSSGYISKHFPHILPVLSTVDMPRKPDQVIHPFYFGDPFRKYTCLWLKGLPKLEWRKECDLFGAATIVEPADTGRFFIRKGNYRSGHKRKLYWQDLLPKKDRAAIKSKTFPGIAAAMADQWG